MAIQMRGEATRQLILEAAAEAFAEFGYGNVSLSDVIARAGVTKGACYHHFPAKEALAAALIAHTDAEMMEKANAATTESASALENLIRVSFAMANVTQRDTKVRVGILLGQALGQISRNAPEGYHQRRAIFVTAITQSVADGDLIDHIDADELGHVIWCSFVGNYLLTAAAGEDLVLGLAKVWRVTLRGIVSPKSASFFEQVIERVAAQYANGLETSQWGRPAAIGGEATGRQSDHREIV